MGKLLRHLFGLLIFQQLILPLPSISYAQPGNESETPHFEFALGKIVSWSIVGASPDGTWINLHYNAGEGSATGYQRLERGKSGAILNFPLALIRAEQPDPAVLVLLLEEKTPAKSRLYRIQIDILRFQAAVSVVGDRDGEMNLPSWQLVEIQSLSQGFEALERVSFELVSKKRNSEGQGRERIASNKRFGVELLELSKAWMSENLSPSEIQRISIADPKDYKPVLANILVSGPRYLVERLVSGLSSELERVHEFKRMDRQIVGCENRLGPQA